MWTALSEQDNRLPRYYLLYLSKLPYNTHSKSEMTASVCSFEVPLILNDLRGEETIVHIIGSITQLTKVSNHIFSTIDQKCDQFQSTLQNLSQVRFCFNENYCF